MSQAIEIKAERVRRPAVAGQFYPADPGELEFQVDRMMTAAYGYTPPESSIPKALIVPHAGYVFSGQIAASGYARLKPRRESITRVVLLGPSHRVPVRGLALPTVDAFQTPIANISLDKEGLAALAELPFVGYSDEAHRREHSLEVHLPFLQEALESFTLLPVVVGDADTEQVAQALERVWGGPETLIVVSSDLSHYLDYDSAQQSDLETAASIEKLEAGFLEPRQACGARPVNGLLQVARKLDLRATNVDLRNSGDTAGTKDRVVGYGTWVLSDNAETQIGLANRRMLLSVAARSIRNGLIRKRRPTIQTGTFEREIENVRASFVTLEKAGRLRGCIGSLMAHRPLVADVGWNAYSAAFEDHRFKPLTHGEFDDLDLSISVLGVPTELAFADEPALVAQLRPGVDGLILAEGKRRGTFLPTVWKQAEDAAHFIRMLKVKAGLPEDYWSAGLKVWRYSTENFGAPITSLGLK